MKELTFEEQFTTYVRAGFPLIGIRTREVDRVTDALWHQLDALNRKLAQSQLSPDSAFLKNNGFQFMTWDCTNGLVAKGNEPFGGTQKTPEAGLTFFLKDQKAVPGVYVFQNVHMFFPEVFKLPNRIQLLRDAYEHGKKNHKHIFLVGDFDELPKDLQPYVIMVDFKLPTEKQIFDYLKVYTSDLGQSFTHKELKAAAKAAVGMTMLEVESALCVSIVASKGKKIDTQVIFMEKAKAVKKTGLLEHMPTDFDLNRDVGGLEHLKTWTKVVSKVFHNPEKAKAYKHPNPKGVLVTGVAGTGKSLFAKCVANEFGVPLFRMDIGRLFGGIVGTTERQTRDVIALAEALAPCVLFIDEIERALAGSSGSGANDSGVTKRMSGNLLTWLQEKQSQVYVVATANEVENLPAPFLRKGRFDELWFVGLPSEAERLDIIKIHILNKGRKIGPRTPFTDAKLKTLAKQMEQFTGSEIEEVIKQGMTIGFFEDREFTVDDIMKVAKHTLPMAVTKAEEVKDLIAWASDKARPASAEAPAKKNVRNKAQEAASKTMQPFW